MTPRDKQVMMFSATLSKDIRNVCRMFMQHKMEFFIDDEAKLTLHGLQQYYIKIGEINKRKKLMDLLDALLFNQVIIFTKTIGRTSDIARFLTSESFPAIAIHGGLNQEERIARYRMFKEYDKRIMIATDIFGRGIDIEKVNIVINYDMPENTDTYLHRVGRAGRFGTRGLAISFVCRDNDDELKLLEAVQSRFEVDIQNLPDQIDASTYMNN